MDSTAALEERQRAAQSWFEALQLKAIAAMEALEEDHSATYR